MKISVLGLGYVGAVSLACLGRDGHHVVGVDIDQNKLELIGSGKSPIVEAGIMELMQQVVASNHITVTDNVEEAVMVTDISFVCVGTPSSANGSQSLSALERITGQIGQAIRKKTEPHTVVIRSTIQPGTLEDVVVPLLERHSGKRADSDFSVCFQPEFLREGTSIKDYDNPPMTVVGVRDQRAARLLRELFGGLPCKFIETDVRTAEELKYACNAFHALKVSFANEIGRISQSLGADSRLVMELLCEDKQLNISSAYLRPGFAFGGSCLPKDLRALLYIAKTHDIEVPVLSALLPSNQLHVEHALRTIYEHGGKRVGIVGLSFKSGTDDLRESPLVTLVEQLIGKGFDLRIFDPEVQLSRLIGANKRYIDEVIPHVGSLMCDSVEETCANAEIVVIGLSDQKLIEQVCACSQSDQFFLDLVGVPDKRKISGTYRGICW